MFLDDTSHDGYYAVFADPLATIQNVFEWCDTELNCSIFSILFGIWCSTHS